ncbi:MAG: DUF3450 domain-containing protein [Arenicella sp.]|nr:DUF3450 domain-containing protein [Arenicella sp.]
MKKSVLNWVGQTLAVVAISATAATVVLAQTVDQEFARELKLVEGLKVYNDQLEDQLKAQAVAKREILVSIDKAKDLEPQVAPLLGQMLSALEKFIKADLPFHKEDRMASVFKLKDLMTNPAASTSSRFRSIMDIYTVEMEYGNNYEAYKALQNVNGEDIEVDMLRMGRIALYFQTKDQKVSAMWDTVNNNWKILSADTNRNIRKAIKVAAKTTAPELLSLPLNAPEGV